MTMWGLGLGFFSLVGWFVHFCWSFVGLVFVVLQVFCFGWFVCLFVGWVFYVQAFSISVTERN